LKLAFGTAKFGAHQLAGTAGFPIFENKKAGTEKSY
jgi:hypothetical protein